MTSKVRFGTFALVLFILGLLLAGCAKKPAPAPAPSTPPPPAPTASISANPSSIERGQSTRLTWRTENATDVSIESIGGVEANGSKDVSPSESQTYRLVAKGPGGTQEATTRVTVTEPPPAPVAQEPSQTDQQWWAQNIKDVYFDYDSYDLRPDAQAAISVNAAALAKKPGFRFVIEGHCDERGSSEYNLALGDKRANAVKSALVNAGVSASRITTTTFGKEKPVCTESNESCWQRNRRGHLVLQ